MEPIQPTERTTLRRLPARGSYDRDLIDSILDEAPVCHVGFAVDGRPFVIPTLHVRVGDRLYVHGAPGSRTLKAMAGGAEACVTVTLIDGLVLARSAFHHSMNYRSVVVFGVAEVVEDPEEKARVLHALSEHLIPGRWADVRGPAPGELKATTILSLPIGEASAKVRTGPPLDDEEDYEAIAAWAGVIPLSMRAGEPIPCPRLAPGIEPPPYARSYPGPGDGTLGD